MAETKSRKTTATRSRKKLSGPPVLQSTNPRTGDVLREIQSTDPAEVKEIVAQARKVQPEWAAIDPEGRARIMREVRYRIYELMDDIVETVSSENGKPRIEALAHDVLAPISMVLSLERIAPKVLRSRTIGFFDPPFLPKLLGGTGTRIDLRPYGVVGCITPWNYPMQNTFLAFTTALFAGNAVVIKPSEVTPGSGELIRQILEPLPPGVATVIQGGADVGAALIDAPVDKVSFIGSPATGRKICEAAAKHLTPVVMELGGIDAAIVCDDADVDLASSGILWGSFYNAGQTCCSIERAYVADAIADEFEEQLVSKYRKVKYRQTDDSEIGPLTFKPQLDTVSKHVKDAVDKGATVLAGGPEASPKNTKGALWYAPTILSDVTDEMDVQTNESFGPVVTVVRVRDEDEAVRRANEDGVNLTASVWTSSKDRANRLAARLRTGTVTVNSHGETAGYTWSAWGGVGESGFGRLNGEYGLREFTVPVPFTTPQLPMKRFWWYPYTENMRVATEGLVKLFGAPTLKEKLTGVREVVAHSGKAIKSKL